MQTVQHHSGKGAGSTYSFNFLHLTIQEFLAANFVATLPNDEQLDVAFQKGTSEYVWLIYAGIIGVQSPGFIKFQTTPTDGFLCTFEPTPTVNSDSKLLFLFQCYLEAKQLARLPEDLSSIFKDGYIDIRHEEMQPYNMVSLINFIIKSNSHFNYFNSSQELSDQ